MREKIRRLINKKAFHVCMVALIISILIISVLFIILRYTVEGETNMPFQLSKISIISTSEGMDTQIENSESMWNFSIDQNNDIYMYIERNDLYGKTEIIDSIVLDNFIIEKQSNKGIDKIYKPDSNEEKVIYKNIEENEVQSVEFIGGTTSNLKKLEISNQGDLVSFRYSNTKVATYSSDEEEINHNEILSKTGIEEKDLKTKLTFNITINLKSQKAFSSTISLDLPVEGLLEKGTVSNEITNLDDIIFKRVKN